MVALVTRRVRFEAAHLLPYHRGKCARLHGHSWTALITVAGEIQPDGMVVDMSKVAAFFSNELEPHMDHAYLNETLPAVYQPPSTENVARYLFDCYDLAGYPVTSVTVHETENQSATYARS